MAGKSIVERIVDNWNITFDSHMKQFQRKMREKGMACDIIGVQQIVRNGQKGKSVLLSIGELNDTYRENYEVFYCGLDIIGHPVKVNNQ